MHKFNVATGMPPFIKLSVAPLQWGSHAMKEYEKDFGPIGPQKEVLLQQEKERAALVEAETSARLVPEKFVVRFPHKGADIVLVVIPTQGGHLFVKTCWKNHKEDKHKTLKTEGLTRWNP